MIDIAHQPYKGEQITLAFLKRYYVWQGMNNQVRQKCRDCVPCNTYTKSRPKEPEVKMRKRPPRPWFMVGMDFFDFRGDHVVHRHTHIQVDHQCETDHGRLGHDL